MNRDRIFLRTDVVGPRLRYVAKEIFERHLGLELVLVNESEPLAIGSVCIGYGIAGQNILIPKSGILEERDFEFNWPGLHKIGAETIENEYVWNDDILGLIFWFLSRFEEYSKSKKSDEHGRYPSSCSMAAMHQILHIPFVDIWVNSLFNQLICNELKPTRVAYERKITIDIDNPTAYRHKGFLRTLAGFGQDILTANFRNANERFQAILNLKEDPYDRFEAIENWLSNEIKPIFFFWIGDYGQFDKGLNWHNPYFQSLVKKISAHHTIGLHPSYNSFLSAEKLKSEKSRLELLSGQLIEMSRQHFLRFRLPETYRQLLDIGIKNDFSMGYSDCFGFRAGTSQPYLWYDLENEAETQLTIHPFCLMDSIAFHKLKLTPAEFHHQINTYESMLKAVGGKLVIVLHNENFHRF